MTKEEAIHVSASLLKNIYDNNNPSCMPALAQIMVAEADGNIDNLCSMLDNVIEFCNKLKKTMYNQE